MKLIWLFIIANLAWAGTAFAQDKDLEDSEVINVENLYKNGPAPAPAKKDAPAADNAPQAEPADVNVKGLTDLNKLAAFSDVSVIQKKYLPKTERFQLYTAAGLTTNSPWFLSLGAKVNLGYNFTESFGVEVGGMFLSSTERAAAKDIRDNNNLQPDKFITTKYHLGVDAVWSPIYGKIAALDNRIIPFDMYFSFGAGTSGTNSQEKNVPTFHVGTGQIFALTQSMAFRWDYSWNFYQATPEPDSSSTSAPQKSTYNDLIFTAGVSFFFPEATYR